MEDIKKKTNKKKATKKSEVKVFQNNSAFKRAMVQMGVKQGDTIHVVYDKGLLYEVKCL